MSVQRIANASVTTIILRTSMKPIQRKVRTENLDTDVIPACNSIQFKRSEHQLVDLFVEKCSKRVAGLKKLLSNYCLGIN